MNIVALNQNEIFTIYGGVNLTAYEPSSAIISKEMHEKQLICAASGTVVGGILGIIVLLVTQQCALRKFNINLGYCITLPIAILSIGGFQMAGTAVGAFVGLKLHGE